MAIDSGQYNATPPTLADASNAHLQLDNRGSLKTISSGYPGMPSNGAPADGVTGVTAADVRAYGELFNGATWDRTRTPLVFKVFSGLAIGSETTIWTPTAGKKFRLMGIVVTIDTANALVTLKDNTAGTTILAFRPIVNTPFVTPAMGNGILSAVANNVLTITAAAANNAAGYVFGTEE